MSGAPRSLRSHVHRILDSRGQLLIVFAVLVGAAAAVLWLGPLRVARTPSSGVSLPWWVVLLACCVAAPLTVRLRLLGATVGCTLGEAAVAFAVLGADPHVLLACYAAASLATHVVRRGVEPAKDLGTVMVDGISVAIAVLVVQVIGVDVHSPLAARTLLAAVAGVAASGIATGILVSAGTAVYQQRVSPRDIARSALLQTLTTTVALSLGVAAFVFMAVQPFLVLLLLPPIVAAALVERVARLGLQRAERTEFLYATSEALHAARPVDERTGAVLQQVMTTFAVGRAELLLVPEARDAALRFICDEAGAPARLARSDLSYAEQEALNALRSHGVIAGRQARSPMSPLHLLLAERGAGAGAAVSLRGSERPQGMLLLLDPLSGDSDLTAAEAHLLSDVAQHITTALENGQLAGALRSMSRERDERNRRGLYDPLTQIANRSLFDESVTRALARLGTSRKPVAVLCIDLDGFAEINERHGHGRGDEVLAAVAARLRTQIRRFDLVARLGGDEFGILLDGMRRRDDAHIVARRIVATLREPLRLADLTVTLSGSLGVAVVDEPATAPPVEELLRRADMAMYLAKRQGKDRYVVFDTGARTSVIAAATPAQAVGV